MKPGPDGLVQGPSRPGVKSRRDLALQDDLVENLALRENDDGIEELEDLEARLVDRENDCPPPLCAFGGWGLAVTVLYVPIDYLICTVTIQ